LVAFFDYVGTQTETLESSAGAWTHSLCQEAKEFIRLPEVFRSGAFSSCVSEVRIVSGPRIWEISETSFFKNNQDSEKTRFSEKEGAKKERIS